MRRQLAYGTGPTCRGKGCVRIYREKVCGARSDRRDLLKLLKAPATGDVVTVTRIDRLARSVQQSRTNPALQAAEIVTRGIKRLMTRRCRCPANNSIRILKGLGKCWHRFSSGSAEHGKRHLANSCVLIFEGLGKCWHDLSAPERGLCCPTNIYVMMFEGFNKCWHGGWADPRERGSCCPANSALISEDLGKCWHGFRSVWAD